MKENIPPKYAEIALKANCSKCRYWTNNIRHDVYRCRMDACPSVKRDKDQAN